MTESRKPIIGINGEFRDATEETAALNWYHSGYFDRVLSANPAGVPVLVPPLRKDEDIRQFLEMIDGLILTGSRLDLDPKGLEMEPHPVSKAMSRRREQFDRKLCAMAVEMRLPILAIGAGMQLLNVVCGGTLLQHIPEDVPRAMPHRDARNEALRHIVLIEEDSRMFEIYGPLETRVNSQHHMAVDRVADLFRVSAKAPDGVVEAFESVDPTWFCIGVQWHPENETASALDIQLFNAFIEASAEAAAPMTIPFPGSAARPTAVSAARARKSA